MNKLKELIDYKIRTYKAKIRYNRYIKIREERLKRIN